MLMLITFANCIYCADLPASPVYHSESLSLSLSLLKHWVPSPSNFIPSSSPQAQLPECYLWQDTGEGSVVTDYARF